MAVVSGGAIGMRYWLGDLGVQVRTHTVPKDPCLISMGGWGWGWGRGGGAR